MTLILHELRHSPFCIPVRRILDAYRISYECLEISNWDRRKLICLTEGNYYQVPVLEHGSDIVYETDSDPLAVAHFLDANFANGELFPTHCQGVHEILITYIEDTLEGIGFKLSDPGYVDTIEDLGERMMVIRHKERKLGAGCVDDWRSIASEISRQFEHCLAPLEARLTKSAFLFGEQPVYADYALFGVLGNAQFGGHYELPESLAKLKQWESRLDKHTAIQ